MAQCVEPGLEGAKFVLRHLTPRIHVLTALVRGLMKFIRACMRGIRLLIKITQSLMIFVSG
jgi:hypothetical protein